MSFPEKIILASQSPRRKQLLEWAEVTFGIIVSATEENIPENTPVAEVPIIIAREKALAVKEKIRHNKALNPLPILAADTVVVLENEIIVKPTDRADAIKILTKLSGKKHQVITGVVILHQEKETAFADITEVEFHELTQEQIVFYIDNYKPYDKAGAYAIQEWIGVIGIKKINGDFYNVMGLPISRVVKAIYDL
jgi:septum formation protein